MNLTVRSEYELRLVLSKGEASACSEAQPCIHTKDMPWVSTHHMTGFL
jgi:hypothetical protein